MDRPFATDEIAVLRAEAARADKAEAEVERLKRERIADHKLRDMAQKFAVRQENRVAALEKQYQELLYEVGSKYPNETRHETARRYIRESEKRTMGDDIASSAALAPREEGR